jgi:hypothetical protein
VVDISKLQYIPLPSRTTIEDVAKYLGVSKAKVHRMKREGLIKRVSNTIKPYLTDKNKKDRLKWCLSMHDQGVYLTILCSKGCLIMSLLMRNGFTSQGRH